MMRNSSQRRERTFTLWIDKLDFPNHAIQAMTTHSFRCRPPFTLFLPLSLIEHLGQIHILRSHEAISEQEGRKRPTNERHLLLLDGKKGKFNRSSVLKATWTKGKQKPLPCDDVSELFSFPFYFIFSNAFRFCRRRFLPNTKSNNDGDGIG